MRILDKTHTLVARPYNRLFRSPEQRSLSRQTSVRELAAMLEDPALSKNVLANLTARIAASEITVENLYLFGHVSVSLAITDANREQAAAILSQAARGDFQFKFEAVGSLAGGGTYTEFRTAPVDYYNLPFFLGLSFSLRQNVWAGLAAKIARLNPELGLVLKNLAAETAYVEKKLVAAYPLPPRQAALAPPEVPIRRPRA